MRTLLAILCASPLALFATPLAAAEPDALFDRVAAIFERRCLTCHNADQNKGDLSLTTAELALEGGESGEVIVPGEPDSSYLLDLITAHEGKAEMPKNADPLEAADVQAVSDWIAAGAKWPAGRVLSEAKITNTDWWSLKPLAEVQPPALSEEDAKWVRTPIDAFILAKLREQHMAPSPEADRQTLIRRVYFDVIGLPPTPEEVAAFVADPDPQAYEKLVEQLLASPRYGERWARHWLDAVHYGDTHGFDKDKVRPNAWPYRDYVIRALNEDKPYTRFIEEQLAGDILYPNTRDGIVATGFIAAGPFDFVGQIELGENQPDKLITRNLDRDDMVSTTMNTFNSLTAQCARCHNHKFDPIMQEDYYRLQAVFAAVDRADRPYYSDPQIVDKKSELEQRLASLEQQQQAIEAEVAKLTTPEIAALDAQIASGRKTIAALPKIGEEDGARTNGYHSQATPGPDATKWVQVDLGAVTPLDQLILVPSHVPHLKHPGPGFGFPLRFKVEASSVADFASDVTVLADYTAADFANPGDVPVGVTPPADTKARYVRITATKLWERNNDYCMAISELVVLSSGENVAAGKPVTALDTIEAGHAWGLTRLVDGFLGKSSVANLTKASGTSPSNGYHGLISPVADETQWVQVDLGAPQPLDTITLLPARPTDFADTPGFGFPVRWRVEISTEADFALAEVVADHTAADFANPGDTPVVLPVGGKVARHVRVTATKLWPRTNDYVFALAEMKVESGGRNLAPGATVTALNTIDGGRWNKTYLVDEYTSRAPLNGAGQFTLLAQHARTGEELRALEARRAPLVATALPAELRERRAQSTAAVDALKAELNALPAAQMVYAAATDFQPQGGFTPTKGKPRPIFVLHRGSEQAPLKEVGPGAISALEDLSGYFDLPADHAEGQRRVALARWIVDQRNPLTWRSIVNRIWLYHFGRGIVDTPNDFGRMGALPSHPELLDWMAREFRDGPQSIKDLHRLMLLSATYRQVSTGGGEFEKLDAGNQYLWRMNRRRIEAEAIYDSVLSAAGKLDLKMGGPGFRAFGFKDDHSPHYKYVEHDPDDPASHRRSIYRFVVRSVPDPFMETLDCADPSLVVAKRNETLTALQALALMNNKFTVRMAEHFAARVEPLGATTPERVAAAFRLALSREPKPEEIQLLTDYAEQHGLPNMCRLLINSNEFLFVD